MAGGTIHVVVAFNQVGDDIAAEQPQQFPSAAAAQSRALALSRSHVGVIAWSRSLDPDTGDYSDPVEIARYGTIPDWFNETGDAGG